MSRHGAPRSLTLTEELEKLEQSITLTLQEIDSNFSKAHRIVTSSILPVVEQYAKHSSDVWEGSKFWKQFFEASANVSLSGYEEPALEGDETQDETQNDVSNDVSTSLQTPTDHHDHPASGVDVHDAAEEEFSVDSPTQVTGLQTTPKLPSATAHPGTAKARFRSPSPRKYTGRNPLAVEPASEGPSTPRPRAVSDPQSSPFEPESAYQPSARPSARRHNSNDALLHRGVLDKNYRIQATPHTQRLQRHQQAATKATTPGTATRRHLWDDSPESSPDVAAPQLRSDLFSPAKGPRTPGVSVLSPARRQAAPTTSTGRQLFSPQDKAYAASRERTSHVFADDSDDDDVLGMSPPKTMQFHVPQSRLMQTPAREASRQIVEDLLLTAGADATDDIEAEGADVEEASPSVVRRALDVDDDTF